MFVYASLFIRFQDMAIMFCCEYVPVYVVELLPINSTALEQSHGCQQCHWSNPNTRTNPNMAKVILWIQKELQRNQTNTAKHNLLYILQVILCIEIVCVSLPFLWSYMDYTILLVQCICSLVQVSIQNKVFLKRVEQNWIRYGMRKRSST